MLARREASTLFAAIADCRPQPWMAITSINSILLEIFVISMSKRVCVCVACVRTTTRHSKDREIVANTKKNFKIENRCGHIPAWIRSFRVQHDFRCFAFFTSRFIQFFLYRCRNTSKKFWTSGIKSMMKFGPKLLYSKVIVVWPKRTRVHQF